MKRGAGDMPGRGALGRIFELLYPIAARTGLSGDEVAGCWRAAQRSPKQALACYEAIVRSYR